MAKEKEQPKKKPVLQKPGILTDQNIATLAELYVGIETWKGYEESKRAAANKVILGFFDSLAKLGYEPRPIGSHIAERKQKAVTQEQVITYLRTWIKEHITVPKNLVDVFPCSELGAHLCRDYKMDK